MMEQVEEDFKIVIINKFYIFKDVKKNINIIRKRWKMQKIIKLNLY